MSWNPSIEPICPGVDDVDAIETLIVPRARDIGNFEVRRALPSAKRQMVGPFVFFDQMGPAEFITEQGIDVRPHPHIGLATVNGPRHIWWNFVASSKEKIEAAKEAWAAGDWEHGRFQLPPTDNDEFIPLPN
jgi:redox-sensitive bicupin YhaK (pirin superfamily)